MLTLCHITITHNSLGNKHTVKVLLIISILLTLPILGCSGNEVPLTSIQEIPTEKYVFPIEAFDPTHIDGNSQWEFNTGGDLIVPLSGTDKLLLSIVSDEDDGSRLLAINVDDGTLAWDYSIEGLASGAPTYYEEHIYIGTKHGSLLCLSASNGDLLWEKLLDDSILGSPVVNEDGIFVSAGRVYRLSTQGNIIWKKKFGVRSVAPVSYLNGILLVISSDNMLYFLNAEKGSKRNGYKIWFSASGGAAIDASAIYITGDKSFVQALDIYSEDYLFGRAIRWWWTKGWLYGLAPPPHYPPGYLWQTRRLGGKGHLSEPIKISPNRHLVQSIAMTKRSRVIRFDPIKGTVIWQTPDQDTTFTDSAVQLDKFLFLSTKSGHTMILNYKTGDLINNFQTGMISQGPIAIKNKLILGLSSGTLWAIELN